jgi:signal transduction histidine kinase/PAS domain-containing protein
MPTNRSGHRTREHLRLIFRQIPGAVWATDRDLRLTYVHGQTGRVDVAESERLVGRTVYDFVGSRAPTEPLVAHHLAALAGGHETFLYQRLDRSYDVVIEPLCDEAGAIVGCVAAALDVTRQRETTRSLVRSFSLLQATLEATADGILVVDREGKVTAFNRRFLSMWHVPATLAERRDDRALLAFVCDQLEDPAAFRDGVRDLYGLSNQEASDVLRFKDGRVFERYSMPQLVSDEVIGRVWSFRDVTERDQLLRRATFLADAARLLSTLDVNKALEAVAHLAVPYLGDYCAVDLLHNGHPDRLVVAGSGVDAKRAPEVHPRALASHSVIYSAASRSHMAVPLMCRDSVIGAVTFVAPQGRAYSKADLELADELARRMALSIDNGRLYQAARQAISGRDEFLAIAAHEIRGPLTSMHLAVQGLQRGTLPPDGVRTALDVIQREDRRLRRFVEELLDLGRIRTGQLHLELEEVDLGTVVRDVVSRLAEDFGTSGSAVTVSTHGTLVGQWDRFRLEQVVTNLLSNAIKYGQGKPVEVSAQGADGRVVLKVVDHGIGIPPAMVAKIFDPYERGVGARHYGGLGLGLHIAKTIVESFGGIIAVDSRPGAGATFTVDLPLARSDQDEAPFDPRR